MTAGGWVNVAQSADILEGNAVQVEFDGEEIAIYRVSGQLYATHNVCTHAFAPLSAGYLNGYEIECPIHQGRFDVRTGAATREPCEEPIQTYCVRERDGIVQMSQRRPDG